VRDLQVISRSAGGCGLADRAHVSTV
jgi:hypothetical protein